jgi:hypothetical protein
MKQTVRKSDDLGIRYFLSAKVLVNGPLFRHRVECSQICRIWDEVVCWYNA